MLRTLREVRYALIPGALFAISGLWQKKIQDQFLNGKKIPKTEFEVNRSIDLISLRLKNEWPMWNGVFNINYYLFSIIIL